MPEVHTSPGRAAACTRAVRWTAIPATSSAITSHSPVWTPARNSSPIARAPSRIARAERTARA
ncbi:MAG: hypothetical protein ACR2MK_02925, partial [Solirubrobacteraceae bacterium]